MTFAARSSEPHTRGTTLQDFYVIEKIGDGAYSEVFKVRRHTDGKIYALKKVGLKELTQAGQDGQAVVKRERQCP